MGKTFRLIILITLALIVLAGCYVVPSRKIRGGQSGTLFSETKTLDRYTKIDFEGGGKIVLVQGNSHSLRIEASQAVLRKIAVKQDGETLHVGFTGRLWGVSATDELIFTFTFENLSEFVMAGGAKIQADALSGGKLELNLDGGFSVDLASLDINILDVSIKGGGMISADGKVNTQNVKIAGAGTYQMAEVESQDVSIKIEGAGNAEVWAKNMLNLELEGAYSVDYWGDPQITQNVTGVGTIKPHGEK